jgi:hypothetical protein
MEWFCVSRGKPLNGIIYEPKALGWHNDDNTAYIAPRDPLNLMTANIIESHLKSNMERQNRSCSILGSSQSFTCTRNKLSRFCTFHPVFNKIFCDPVSILVFELSEGG